MESSIEVNVDFSESTYRVLETIAKKLAISVPDLVEKMVEGQLFYNLKD